MHRIVAFQWLMGGYGAPSSTTRSLDARANVVYGTECIMQVRKGPSGRKNQNPPLPVLPSPREKIL